MSKRHRLLHSVSKMTQMLIKSCHYPAVDWLSTPLLTHIFLRIIRFFITILYTRYKAHNTVCAFKDHKITKLKLKQNCPLLISKRQISHINRSSCCFAVYCDTTIIPFEERHWQDCLVWCVTFHFSTRRLCSVCLAFTSLHKSWTINDINTLFFKPVQRDYAGISQ